jgi:hypothetical protein
MRDGYLAIATRLPLSLLELRGPSLLHPHSNGLKHAAIGPTLASLM